MPETVADPVPVMLTTDTVEFTGKKSFVVTLKFTADRPEIIVVVSGHAIVGVNTMLSNRFPVDPLAGSKEMNKNRVVVWPAGTT